MSPRSALFVFLCFALAVLCGPASSAELLKREVVTLNKNVFVPVTTNTASIARTVPFREYPLIGTTANGYIVLLDKAPFSPPIGFIKKVNRLSNPTAKEYQNTIEINSMINEPVSPGYIPFAAGARYAVVASDDTHYTLLFSNKYVTTTGRVPRVDCAVVSDEAIKLEQRAKAAEEAQARKEIEAALKTSEYGGDYDQGIKELRRVLGKYPKHEFTPRVLARLKDINNEGYWAVHSAILSGNSMTNDQEAIASLEYILSVYSNTVLTKIAIQTLEQCKARLADAQAAASKSDVKTDEPKSNTDDPDNVTRSQVADESTGHEDESLGVNSNSYDGIKASNQAPLELFSLRAFIYAYREIIPTGCTVYYYASSQDFISVRFDSSDNKQYIAFRLRLSQIHFLYDVIVKWNKWRIKAEEQNVELVKEIDKLVTTVTWVENNGDLCIETATVKFTFNNKLKDVPAIIVTFPEMSTYDALSSNGKVVDRRYNHKQQEVIWNDMSTLALYFGLTPDRIREKVAKHNADGEIIDTFK